ncbi:MAG: hypothetical protein WC749_02170 [Dehalococcoidia bacterium]
MDKLGAIYYTDFHVDPFIMKVCQEQIKKAFNSDIVSVSLNGPLSFGRNFVYEDKLGRSYPAMVRQIIMALERLTTEYVFFLEHDVLYSESHFDFIPPTDDVYYYNVHNWRWLYPQDHLITYNELTSLSGMCCNRELALRHYELRWKRIDEFGLYNIRSREPGWARKMGYEPGTKPRRRGGFSDEGHEKWRSVYPNIDIRHRQTYSPPKVYLKNFKHQPEEWQEGGFEDVSFWNLPGRFCLNKLAVWNYCWWSGETAKGGELA